MKYSVYEVRSLHPAGPTVRGCHCSLQDAFRHQMAIISKEKSRAIIWHSDREEEVRYSPLAKEGKDGTADS